MNKKYLIVNPKNGLCNQLSCISIGIIFGLLTNRDVIFKSFQIDYKDFENVCSFDSIIDISHIQNILNYKRLNIHIYSNSSINGTKIITNSNQEISNIKDFIPILFLKENINTEYLDIGSPISSNIPNEYKSIQEYINLNIKFTKKYIDIAKTIKNKLGLNYYCCIHLRLENDAINFMKELNPILKEEYINNLYKEKYIEQIKMFNNKTNIYICTSLGIHENINNDFYKEIKTKYNLIDKNDIIKITDNNCREIFGIIDYIIAQESEYFVGCDWSSFSILIYSHHIYNKKNSHLINIWDTLKNIKV
jgi:hypothetical protein